MVESDVEQWHPGEMPLSWIEECVRAGWIYGVWRDRSLVASVTLVWADPLVWPDHDDPAGYIHMLMVDRRWAGQGIGGHLLDWTEDQIRSVGCPVARLDCVRTNATLRAYYEAAGYVLVGVREFKGVKLSAVATVEPPGVALYEKKL